MKIVTVVGARPQFVKAAALSRRLRDPAYASLREAIVHTGQHYDDNMSARFFEELGIPAPVANLGIGGGTQGEQTGRMLPALERVFAELAPDLVLVYGDTNSTLAAALVAAKAGLPIAHVEAGLRSHRPAMAEEINRVVTDRLSAALFAPTGQAMENLAREGLADRAHRVGDVMLDAYRHSVRGLDEAAALREFGLAPKAYILATAHRAENTDRPAPLREIVAALAAIARERQVLFPVHPRTKAALVRSQISTGALRLVEPQPYARILALLRNAAALATDSGGMQKEAYFSAVPCVTLRDETEWVETISSGWNRLAPPASGRAAIEAAIRDAAATRPQSPPPPVYGDGDAAGRILSILAARA